MDIIIDDRLAGTCVRDVLRRELRYSSNMIKKLKFTEGALLVNGSFVTVRYVLREGDVLSLAVEDKPEDVSPYTLACEIPIEIVYEDEYVTVVNKSAQMPSHPSLSHKTDTVSNALAYRYRDKNYVFRPVNRLDRDTSGCMLTANTKAASYRMYLSMTGGEIRKSYVAVTDGVPPASSGELRDCLRRCEGSIIMREVAPDGELDPDAKLAVTTYEVLYTDGEHSVLKLSPITGRTHQIRVQLAHIGCAVTGDDMYGRASEYISRQALHSYVTRFPHPATDEEICAVAPLHEDMKKLIRELFDESERVFEIIENAK